MSGAHAPAAVVVEGPNFRACPLEFSTTTSQVARRSRAIFALSSRYVDGHGTLTAAIAGHEITVVGQAICARRLREGTAPSGACRHAGNQRALIDLGS